MPISVGRQKFTGNQDILKISVGQQKVAHIVFFSNLAYNVSKLHQDEEVECLRSRYIALHEVRNHPSDTYPVASAALEHEGHMR